MTDLKRIGTLTPGYTLNVSDMSISRNQGWYIPSRWYTSYYRWINGEERKKTLWRIEQCVTEGISMIKTDALIIEDLKGAMAGIHSLLETYPGDEDVKASVLKLEEMIKAAVEPLSSVTREDKETKVPVITEDKDDEKKSAEMAVLLMDLSASNPIPLVSGQGQSGVVSMESLVPPVGPNRTPPVSPPKASFKMNPTVYNCKKSIPHLRPSQVRGRRLIYSARG